MNASLRRGEIEHFEVLNLLLPEFVQTQFIKVIWVLHILITKNILNEAPHAAFQ